MSMQYPHHLFKLVVSGSIQDADGNWSTPGSSYVYHSECREETNGKGSFINGIDGKAVVFSSTVYLPGYADRIAEGTEVIVSESKDVAGFTRAKGKVLNCDKTRLSGRVWL